MKPLIFLSIFFLTACTKEHYNDLTERVKPLVMEQHTLTVTQVNKLITIKLTADAKPYRRNATIEMVFDGRYEIGHVIYVQPGVTQIEVSPFSSQGTLTSYRMRSFGRYEE